MGCRSCSTVGSSMTATSHLQFLSTWHVASVNRDVPWGWNTYVNHSCADHVLKWCFEYIRSNTLSSTINFHYLVLLIKNCVYSEIWNYIWGSHCISTEQWTGRLRSGGVGGVAFPRPHVLLTDSLCIFHRVGLHHLSLKLARLTYFPRVLFWNCGGTQSYEVRRRGDGRETGEHCCCSRWALPKGHDKWI